MLIAIAYWKIGTELLYPISGPLRDGWEWVERGGDYVAPFALMFALALMAELSGPRWQGRLARHPEPGSPKILNFVELGKGSGPHYLTLSPDEDRMVVSDDFLVEDLIPSDVVGVDGDHKVHVLNVVDDRLLEDPTFDLDFNRDVATGPCSASRACHCKPKSSSA